MNLNMQIGDISLHILLYTLKDPGIHFPHFIDEETEAQRGYINWFPWGKGQLSRGGINIYWGKGEALPSYEPSSSTRGRRSLRIEQLCPCSP